ncbi:MAG: TetR/AcrR family transcriptional regulator [Pseudomonadota bacterium]
MQTRESNAVDTAGRIMDVAERLIRTGGYDAFSFREIATELGIKSASVHYHYATKADLVAAVAKRYTDRFIDALGDNSGDPEHMIDHFIANYRASVAHENLMCLCGMLGAEIARIPPSVADHVIQFFHQNLEWIRPVLARRGDPDPYASAYALVAALEGGLLLARSIGSLVPFDAAARQARRL